MSEREKLPHGNYVGVPAAFYLDEFASQVMFVFEDSWVFQVGSSTYSKQWRDVDVRVILTDEEWEQWNFGNPQNPNGKWRAMCMAFGELGRKMTGLPIDFQIQQMTDANERFRDSRNALGIVELRLPKESK